MEEIEAREAEWKPGQDFGSLWNARSQKYRRTQTKLEAWLEERDSNARREKYAGIACVDASARRYPDPAKTITEQRSQRVAALPETAKGKPIWTYSMLFGGLFIALCNGLDDEAGRERWACLRTSPTSTNFSPSERDAFYTTLKMADDVFLQASERKSKRDRSYLRLVN